MGFESCNPRASTDRGGVVEVQEEIVLVTRAQSDSVGEPLQRPLAHSQGASNVLIRH